MSNPSTDSIALSPSPIPPEVKKAGLVYGHDRDPGIVRLGSHPRFRFRTAEGKAIVGEERQRILALAIPPAWVNVWICPEPRGHIQATGRDERGRKQYRYHSDWSASRGETKFESLVAFGRALPALRRRLRRDLKKPGLTRDPVLAGVVTLLETTHIRVGNEEYARSNKSYGLTTLRDRHAKIRGGSVRFEFPGKSGVRHAIDLADRHLAKFVKQCQDLPGQALFQYRDEAGICHAVKSDDVNAYLAEATGQDYTAKHFRTWAGTVLAAAALAVTEPPASEAEAKRQMLGAVDGVARELGNTRTVCRQSYIHPRVLAAFSDVALRDRYLEARNQRVAGLTGDEAALLHFLMEKRSKRAS